MRLLLIFIFLFSLVLQNSAQGLSPKKLLQLRMIQPEELTNKLAKKGWSFMLDNKPTKKIMGRAVLAYKPVEVGNMEKGAEAWCVLYYSPESESRILYNNFGQVTMQKIKKMMRKKAMKAIDQGNELKGVSSLAFYTDYADHELVFRVMTYEYPNRFGIKIFGKEDYLKAKKNDRL